MKLRKPVIGLALGGGGIRGLAHIGILKIIEREGISISCLSGTSMGGMIAACYAAGVPLELLAHEAERMGNLTRLVELVDRQFHLFSGLLTNTGVRKYLARFLGDHPTFESLNIPLALTAVDNLTGREVVLQTGDLLEAINATMALPGVVAPVQKDGMLLSDGGTLNNVPADLVRSRGVEQVIAVNVSPAVHELFLNNRMIPAAASAVWRANNIANAAITVAKLRKAQPDLILYPEICANVTTLTGFRYAREIILSGEKAALKALPQLHCINQACLLPAAPQLEKSAAYEI